MMSGLTIDGLTTHESVQKYYGKVLSSTKDLKTSACCPSSAPHPLMTAALKKVPKEIKDKYYGCGCPLPLGIEGLSVLGAHPRLRVAP